MENPINMDDLGVFHLFLETPVYFLHIWEVFFQTAGLQGGICWELLSCFFINTWAVIISPWLFRVYRGLFHKPIDPWTNQYFMECLGFWSLLTFRLHIGDILLMEKNPKQPPGMVLKPVVNNGRNYQPQQVFSPDFEQTISSRFWQKKNRSHWVDCCPVALPDLFEELGKPRKPCERSCSLLFLSFSLLLKNLRLLTRQKSAVKMLKYESSCGALGEVHSFLSEDITFW